MATKYYSLKDREGLAPDNFGDIKRRLFLIEKQDDVDKAPKRLKRAHEPEKVRNRIMEIAARKGLLIPAEWLAEVAIEKSPESSQE